MQCFGLYAIMNLFFHAMLWLYAIMNLFFHAMLWFIRNHESVFPFNALVYMQS